MLERRMKNTPRSTPPRNSLDAPIVGKISHLYKELYRIGKKIPKRDRFGLHADIESRGRACLTLAVEAALTGPSEKRPLVRRLQVNLETLTHLVRMEHELKIIDEETWVPFARLLVEISKNATSWLTYLNGNLQKQ